MKLREIALIVHAEDKPEFEHIEITRITSLDEADASCITFMSKDVFLDHALNSHAAAILVKKGISIPGKILVEVDDPYLAYAKVAQIFEVIPLLFTKPSYVHPTALIDDSARVDCSAAIGPYCVIGKNCTVGPGSSIGSHSIIEEGVCIGSGCRIDPAVVLRRSVQIGNRVIIQSGSIVGSEGFGNALDRGVFVRIPCFGTVVIEDDVEIGANVTVDRGNFTPTVIHKGTRIDNLVHIAHNVTIGKHSALAAQVGVSGSTTIGDHVMIAGQAGFVGHITIGSGSFIGAQAGVSKSVLPGEKVTGYPARDIMKTRRVEAVMHQLPNIYKEFKQLKKEVELLKQQLHSERG